MLQKQERNSSKILLAIHSTNKFFGFAYRELKKINFKEDFFTKEFDKNLSNNLICDLSLFLSKKSFKSIERISVSVGPANFNASRTILACARTLSQQIGCSLDGFSNFELMAKRIAIKNKMHKNNHKFWIINKLKRRGYIAGQYLINYRNNELATINVKELIKPKLYEQINIGKSHYEANYHIKEELKELLELSSSNYQNSVSNSWEKVLPIYPISATN